MRYPDRDNDNLPVARFQCGRANREGRHVFLYDNTLCVGCLRNSIVPPGGMSTRSNETLVSLCRMPSNSKVFPS